mmetsp:Transcript_4747/g.7207  ORF Transcript_4747/g.7207 Transcript_4747/m.7207 type:complete len:128 (+) Transcript_4747:156-539(+)
MVFHFILPFLMKNATLMNAYYAAESYGFHRIYRRMLEALKKSNLDDAHMAMVSDNIKHAMRYPSSAYVSLTESHTSRFIVKFSEDVLKKADVHPAVLAAANVLFKRTPAGKLIDVFKRAAEKKKKKQ